ncbi:MAG: phosphatase PAP2 family protein [Chitinophagaceae bacterium]|nr:phosphatase PAP2 family protein [Chitinophagaceae bacterium]
MFGIICQSFTIFEGSNGYGTIMNTWIKAGMLPVLLLGLFACLQAQAPPDTASAVPASYLGSYWQVGKAMAASPARWKGESWFQFGGSVAIIGAIIPMDNVLNVPFENWQQNGAKRFGEAGDVVGGLPFQFGFTGAAWGVGLLAKNKPMQHFALDNLQAQLYTGGITFVIKELFHRARPETGLDGYNWFGPFNGRGNDSFISGHTSLSFATATMVFLHSKKKWWVGLAAYGVATGVGISRMQMQKHWASDVIGGALVGTAVSAFVYRQQQMRRSGKKLTQLKPLP